ncbi:MAG: HEAT repeat domain-containing protein, partial [Verrucomicrobiaceae bacterium]
MEFLDILLLGVVIIALCVMGMGRFLKSRTPQQAWGFKDVVKDPSYWDQSVHALHKAEQAVQAAKSWNDATVDRAVTAYLFEINRSQDAWIEQRQLEGLESRTHRRVLELLSGTTPYQKWVTPTAENDPPEAPIERACELLGYRPPTEAIPLLAPFLEDVNSSVRKSVASCLGKTGRPAAAPFTSESGSP